MKKILVGDKIATKEASWNFKGNVPKNFDLHVSKSVPLYFQTHDIGLKLSDFFVIEKSNIIDIGCSTGTFVNKLFQRHKDKKIKISGYDIEKDMINFAKKKNKNKAIRFKNSDILKVKFKNCDFVTSYYSIQFIHPSKRQQLVEKIYKGLRWGGGFLFFEKVRANDARFQDMMTLLYHDMKLENNFSADEIVLKSKSLKGVMEPFSTTANFQLLKRSGFKDVISVFKFLCFQGFLAIK